MMDAFTLPEASVPALLRHPSPIPVGESVEDYVLTRPEPLVQALNAVLAVPVGVHVGGHWRYPAHGRIAGLLGVDDGTLLGHRTERIFQLHPARLYCYGFVLYSVLLHRLPPTLQDRLAAETGPLEAALAQQADSGAVHRVLIGRSPDWASRTFIVRDQRGPIAHADETVWTRGKDTLAPSIVAASAPANHSYRQRQAGS